MIRHRGIFILFISFCTVLNTSIAQNSWINYKASEVIPFSVDVPGLMDTSSQTIKTAVGSLITQTYAYQGTSDDPNYLYLINFVEYPTGTFPSDSIDLINDYLDNSVLTSAEKVGGKLVYASDLENVSGKLFRIKYNDGNAVIKGKSYIRNDVFISLQVFTVQSKSLNDEMDYFLDSFKLNGL